MCYSGWEELRSRRTDSIRNCCCLWYAQRAWSLQCKYFCSNDLLKQRLLERSIASEKWSQSKKFLSWGRGRVVELNNCGWHVRFSVVQYVFYANSILTDKLEVEYRRGWLKFHINYERNVPQESQDRIISSSKYGTSTLFHQKNRCWTSEIGIQLWRHCIVTSSCPDFSVAFQHR